MPWHVAYRIAQDLRVYRRAGAEETFDYTDGDAAEERLLSVVRAARDLSDGSPELSAAISDWPSLYHLSPRRANLLRPLAPLLSGDVLEVGAGCGALTRFLGERAARVVALEPALRRASVAAARCRDLPNVSVVCDRLERFPRGTTFDAVTLVGVLEYAPKFSDEADACGALLREAASRLAPGGALVVAIENQFGLKYLAGYPEDHVGRPMFGVNDLYGPGTPVTFGRAELTARLADAGFASTEVWVPLPDYKVPTAILTPEGLSDPAAREAIARLAALSPADDPQAPEQSLFSLPLAWEVVARNGLVADLANSFLLVCRREAAGEGPAPPGLLAVRYDVDRRPELRAETRVTCAGGAVRITRALLAGTAPREGAAGVAPVLGDEPFVPGRTLLSEILRRAVQPGWKIEDLLPPLVAWVAALPPGTLATRVSGRHLDETPLHAVFAPDGALRFTGREWESKGDVELGRIVHRGVVETLASLASLAQPAAGVPRGILPLARVLGERLGFALSEGDVARYEAEESALRAFVRGAAPETAGRGEIAVRWGAEALLGALAWARSHGA